MNILVISKTHLVDRELTIPNWQLMRNLGHNVIVDSSGIGSDIKPDVMISMGVSLLQESFDALKKYPQVPLVSYNWDCYEYVWEPGKGGYKQAYNPSRPNEYDYVRYGNLLETSEQIWVPSLCTALRTSQWWKRIPLNRIKVVKSSCPYWNYDNVTDEGYIYCALREIPDKWWDKLEQACEELGLPLLMSKHELGLEEYRKAVAGCRFIVAHPYELSTGGLSLLEAYYLGKPVLINSSQWNGGRDYLGDRAMYFKDCDYDSLKRWLLAMYHDPRPVHSDHQWYVMNRFSDERMIDDMLTNLKEVVS